MRTAEDGFVVGLGCGGALAAIVIMAALWGEPSVALVAQKHCEQSGHAIGRYENERIVCYDVTLAK